jgi:hypothetical protein
MVAVLVGDQMNLDNLQLEQAQWLGIYVALHHVPYFLACPLAASAPYNDLFFIQQIRSLKKTDEEIAMAVPVSLTGQVRYLDAPWLTCALVDKRVPKEEKQRIAIALMSFPQPTYYPPTPAQPGGAQRRVLAV